MATRRLYLFRHSSDLGNAHAHALFNRLVATNVGPRDVPGQVRQLLQHASTPRAIAPRHGTNRYPTPASVTKCFGIDASASTFLRKLAMCTRT